MIQNSDSLSWDWEEGTPWICCTGRHIETYHTCVEHKGQGSLIQRYHTSGWTKSKKPAEWPRLRKRAPRVQAPCIQMIQLAYHSPCNAESVLWICSFSEQNNESGVWHGFMSARGVMCFHVSVENPSTLENILTRGYSRWAGIRLVGLHSLVYGTATPQL